MAVATTFDLPNFVGELFSTTPTETPFLSMIGGLNGGREANAKVFTWQEYDLSNPSQPAIVEAAAPTSAQVARTEGSNVVQIFQYAVDLSYTKMAATGQLGTPTAAASPVLGMQPVQNEMAFQVSAKLRQAALDVEFTFHQGAYQNPTDNTTGRKTRGMDAAITTGGNVEAAGSNPLTTTHIDTLLAAMWTAGAPFIRPVMFSGIFQKQGLSGLYGYAPESRNVGGVNINVIETDTAVLEHVLARHVLASVLSVYEMTVCAPRFLPIPGKGHFFMEPMAKTKASDEAQLYGEIGLEHGPEEWHGQVSGLTTS